MFSFIFEFIKNLEKITLNPVLLSTGAGGWEWPRWSCQGVYEGYRCHQPVQEYERNVR